MSSEAEGMDALNPPSSPEEAVPIEPADPAAENPVVESNPLPTYLVNDHRTVDTLIRDQHEADNELGDGVDSDIEQDDVVDDHHIPFQEAVRERRRLALEEDDDSQLVEDTEDNSIRILNPDMNPFFVELSLH